jgi:hypothetical protein
VFGVVGSPPPSGPPPSAAAAAAPASALGAGPPVVAVAKYVYNARSEKEVTLSVGQETTLIKTYGNGWALVETRDGQRGIVPSSYLDTAAASSFSSSSAAAAASTSSAMSGAATSSVSGSSGVSSPLLKSVSPRRVDQPASATVRAAAYSPRKSAQDALGGGQPQTAQRKAETSEEMASLRREIELLKEASAREREQEREAKRERDREMREMTEVVGSFRKEIDKLRSLVNRVSREKEAADAMIGQKFVELEEEIEGAVLLVFFVVFVMLFCLCSFGQSNRARGRNAQQSCGGRGATAERRRGRARHSQQTPNNNRCVESVILTRCGVAVLFDANKNKRHIQTHFIAVFFFPASAHSCLPGI